MDKFDVIKDTLISRNYISDGFHLQIVGTRSEEASDFFFELKRTGSSG